MRSWHYRNSIDLGMCTRESVEPRFRRLCQMIHWDVEPKRKWTGNLHPKRVVIKDHWLKMTYMYIWHMIYACVYNQWYLGRYVLPPMEKAPNSQSHWVAGYHRMMKHIMNPHRSLCTWMPCKVLQLTKELGIFQSTKKTQPSKIAAVSFQVVLYIHMFLNVLKPCDSLINSKAEIIMLFNIHYMHCCLHYEGPVLDTCLHHCGPFDWTSLAWLSTKIHSSKRRWHNPQKVIL